MLNAGESMFAYRFEGYWKDVGTIESLWESNMDLLDPNIPLDLNDPEWRIYSRNPVMPPHYVAKGANHSELLGGRRAAMSMARWISLCCSRASM